MPKSIQLDPIGAQAVVQTNDNLMSALLKNDLNVLKECGGRGMCATCHIYIKAGMENLSPLNRREQRTLNVITTHNKQSRLACQTRVLGEGVIVEVPQGMYLNHGMDVDVLIGRRAQENILHPLTGQILVEEGKLITRSMITQLEVTLDDVNKHLANSTAI